ncbi:MAG: hypothetical protein WCC60_23585 [Ilumatobacteraceae bacterium]
MHSTTNRTTRRLRRTAALVGALAATTLAVGLTAGSASAMTTQQWRTRCLNSGGEWDSYVMNGATLYECLWVTGSGYSIDIYRGGRFVETCGSTRGSREICDQI